MSSAAGRLTDDLTRATLNQTDPRTVRDGGPAFLLMIDGFIEGDPENPQLLLTGAKLYGAYLSAFVEDEQRARRLASKSLGYAHRALCLSDEELCQATSKPYDVFSPLLRESDESAVEILYGFGAAWASWLQASSSDWNAIAELPKIEAVMRRVVELRDDIDEGTAHIYLGVLNTQLPPSMGGKPDVGRHHFERAIELSHGHNLMAKVLFAKQYARLVFDQELHDRLLRDVLEADPEYPGLTLSNTLAKQQAMELLADSSDYF